jgi:hypothetical protein
MPLSSKLAVCSLRAVLRLPVAVQVPSAGLYSSALAEGSPLLSSPAATSTKPLGSNVAVCNTRAVLRLSVVLHIPLEGSYSSALVKGLNPSHPPATSTLPLGSSVAV